MSGETLRGCPFCERESMRHFRPDRSVVGCFSADCAVNPNVSAETITQAADLWNNPTGGKPVLLVNGDKCSYKDENIEYLYIGLNPVKPLFSYVVGNGQIVQRLTSKLARTRD
ncbi:hypothetical protein VPHK389_0005 [Vibrio phage K389]|nr:hypothetical protein SIPHO010v1_p0087 [Vibrio phage 268E42.1]